MMRAMLCKDWGPADTLVLEEVESRPLGEGEVRVRVAACGVNFPDTLIIEGKYQFKPDLPFSPGGEVSGTVAEVGPGVTSVNVGDPVIAITLWGGFAEEVVVPAEKIIRRPAAMDDVTAAAFSMTYGTSYHALKQRADLQPGETLLVLGAAGGVGLAAVQLGKVMGARVIAAASSDEKLAVARANGADDTVNYSGGSLRDQVKDLTNGKGADVVYDPVGGDLTEQALRATAWKGRLLIVGFASGTIPRIPANLALLKGCAVVGVFWGDFVRREGAENARNFADLFALYEQGKIKPEVSQTYPLERAADALKALAGRQAIGKIVLTI